MLTIVFKTVSGPLIYHLASRALIEWRGISSGVRLAVITIAALLLSACQPSYTADQTEVFARTVGVTKQFDIQRRNNRLIPVDSRVVVAAASMPEIDSSALSGVIAHGLSPYFDSAVGGYGSMSLQAARKKAISANHNYLIYVTTMKGMSASGSGNTDPHSDYTRMHLLLTVVDVLSGQTFDKIQLTAKSASWNFLGNHMNDLLAKPVAVIAQDLTGL